MIYHLIWDVDGTLFDTYPAMTQAMVAALRDMGFEYTSDIILPLLKRTFSVCVDMLVEKHLLDAAELKERYLAHYREVPPERQPPFAGAREVCLLIQQRGGQNFIVTHRRRASLLRLLKVHQMGEYFADMLTASDDYPRKPEPAAFLTMIEKHDLTRSEVLAIGDRDIDTLAARAAGLCTCLFGAAEATVPADYVISDFYELHRALRNDEMICG